MIGAKSLPIIVYVLLLKNMSSSLQTVRLSKCSIVLHRDGRPIMLAFMGRAISYNLQASTFSSLLTLSTDEAQCENHTSRMFHNRGGNSFMNGISAYYTEINGTATRAIRIPIACMRVTRSRNIRAASITVAAG